MPEEYSQYDLTFKIIVIGDSFVGKSCLTNKGIKNVYEDSYSATVGFEFITSNIKVNDKVCKMQIWDTCGQERFMSIAKMYYIDANVVLLVLDCTSEDSLKRAMKQFEKLENETKNITVILVINKVDKLFGYQKGKVDEHLL